jgi:RNA polymerase sigma factor (sigma-70 family)
MTHDTLTYVLRQLHRLTDPRTARDLSDSELLERFRAGREEAAFAVLVQRHGPMVLGVCRRLLDDAGLAEDAFQATFLVLVRRAGSIRKQASVASWLYGVARRVAARARAQAARRRIREREIGDMPAAEPRDDRSWSELRAVLDEELGRLPEKCRTAVVLCYLEGKTQEQAARELGWPRTSLASRLGRARTLLRQRLTRRGLVLSAGVLATALAAEASAAPVPALLLLSTTRAASLVAAGKTAAAAVSPQAAALAEGVCRTMSMTKIILGVALTASLAFTVSTVSLTSRRACPGGAAAAEQPAAAAADDTAAPKPDESQTPLFRDVTEESGIDFTFRNGEEAGLYTILESLGGGIGVIDYDGDGLLDLFIIGGGSFEGPNKQIITGRPCKLYRNLGNGKFKDVTAEAGLDKITLYSHGCAVADYDEDGWPDLFITGYGSVALFHNEPDGKGGRRFVDVTKKAGLGAGFTWPTSAAWGDLDGDGFPDLYVCQYVDWSFANNPECTYDGKTRDICPPKNFTALPHKMFHNNGDGTFTDVSKAAGLRMPREDKDYDQLSWMGEGARRWLRDAQKEQDYGKGLGVVIADVNGDGKPDIWVANDTTDNFLYMNRSIPGQIRLEEVGLAAGVARDDRGVSYGSHGVDAGDYDGSGRPALWVVNYQAENHSLYHNECRRPGEDRRSPNGREYFRYASTVSGITAIGQIYVGWGTGFVDVDNDGWQDLVISNGHVLLHPVKGSTRQQRPVLLHNEGKGKFKDISDQAGMYFQGKHLGRGLAIADLDNDGNLDLVISHLNEPVVLLRNQAPRADARAHWLGIELAGDKNRDVAGTHVKVEVGGRTLTRFAMGGGSYLSSSDRRLVFGLGLSEKIDRVLVTWPSGKEQQWQGDQIKTDHYWRLVEGKDAPEQRK